MKKYSRVLRTAFLFLLMLGIAAVLITRLAYIQLSITPEEAARSTTTRSYTVLASRGEIYDREGRPLVSNELGFNVELDYYEWDKQAQNAVILRLCKLLSDAGIEYSDELPITASPPYSYTFDSVESQAAKKLYKLIAEQEDWPQSPTAPELFSLLCDRYAVDKDLLLSDKRIIVGVRYYLDLRQFSLYNTPVTMAQQVDIETVARISERSLELPGVTIQETGVRQYNTTYAAHVLGRVAAIGPEEYEQYKDSDAPYKLNDSLGKDGMEKALEAYLRGRGGKMEIEVSKATGEVVSQTIVPGQEPDPGDHCYLTLDLPLQQVVEDALALGIEQVRQKGEQSKDKKGADIQGGAAVVLDIKTGEVLAMASYPTFDLSRYSQDFAQNNADPLQPMFNRAVQGGGYPPGSTFKMATAVAALETGTVTPQTKIRDEGVYMGFAGDTRHPACWIWNQRRTTHGTINISQALAYSCNYYFFKAAHDMGVESLREYCLALGLGQRTGIELPGETAGTLDGPEVRGEKNAWQQGDVLSMAIGQGANQFSPLQLANYMATILRGGTRLEAHLLKRVVDYTGRETVFEQQPVVLQETPLEESTIKAVKEGMKGVVTDDGTASSYFRNFPADIGVGGKTGSAENARGSAHGVFLSFAPYDDPEIVVVVIGEQAGTGGSMSPICIEIYNHYFDLSIDVGLMTTTPEPEPPDVPVAPIPTTTQPQTDPEETPDTTEPEPEPVEATTQPPEQTTVPETTAAPDTTEAGGQGE